MGISLDNKHRAALYAVTQLLAVLGYYGAVDEQESYVALATRFAGQLGRRLEGIQHGNDPDLFSIGLGEADESDFVGSLKFASMSLTPLLSGRPDMSGTAIAVAYDNFLYKFRRQLIGDYRSLAARPNGPYAGEANRIAGAIENKTVSFGDLLTLRSIADRLKSKDPSGPRTIDERLFGLIKWQEDGSPVFPLYFRQFADLAPSFDNSWGQKLEPVMMGWLGGKWVHFDGEFLYDDPHDEFVDPENMDWLRLASEDIRRLAGSQDENSAVFGSLFTILHSGEEGTVLRLAHEHSSTQTDILIHAVAVKVFRQGRLSDADRLLFEKTMAVMDSEIFNDPEYDDLKQRLTAFNGYPFVSEGLKNDLIGLIGKILLPSWERESGLRGGRGENLIVTLLQAFSRAYASMAGDEGDPVIIMQRIAETPIPELFHIAASQRINEIECCLIINVLSTLEQEYWRVRDKVLYYLNPLRDEKGRHDAGESDVWHYIEEYNRRKEGGSGRNGRGGASGMIPPASTPQLPPASPPNSTMGRVSAGQLSAGWMIGARFVPIGRLNFGASATQNIAGARTFLGSRVALPVQAMAH